MRRAVAAVEHLRGVVAGMLGGDVAVRDVADGVAVLGGVVEVDDGHE